MKKIIGFLFLLSFVVVAQDNTRKVYNDPFVPKTLFAGVSMTSRTDTAGYDDTTRYFNTRGYAAVYVGIESASNDSGDIILQYRTSHDGVNNNGAGFVTFDSCVISATNTHKYYALPATALGAYATQVRAYQQTTFAKFSINPTTKITTKVIRVPYNDVKLK